MQKNSLIIILSFALVIKTHKKVSGKNNNFTVNRDHVNNKGNLLYTCRFLSVG